MRQLRLASRASPLALWQARFVAARLRARHAGLVVTIHPIISSGDRDRQTALYASSDVGMFVREIQEAVLAGRCDAGVHSCKDLPTTMPAGLLLGAVPARVDVRDCLVGASSIVALPTGALIGTSSLRRQFQLAALRPDLRFTPIRGNVETRLGKIADGALAGTILACAGLSRLGLMRRAQATPFTIEEMVPAPAQGAIAIDCRVADHATRWLLQMISDNDAQRAVAIERAVLSAFTGGCSLPLGCHARRTARGWLVQARLSAAGSARHAHYLGDEARAAAAVALALGA